MKIRILSVASKLRGETHEALVVTRPEGRGQIALCAAPDGNGSMCFYNDQHKAPEFEVVEERALDPQSLFFGQPIKSMTVEFK